MKTEIKGCLHVCRGNEEKLRLPGPSVGVGDDGTLWMNGIPILGGVDDSKIKADLAAKVRAKKFGEIESKYFVKLGQNENGIFACDDDGYKNHPANKIEMEKLKACEIEEAKKVRIFLSARGWGDYSSLEWYGDITRPEAEILAECKKKFEIGCDVDSKYNEEEVLSAIRAAKTKHAAPKIEAKPESHGPGYCYSCQTYCFGDCGDYRPTRDAVIVRREVAEINREANYGISEEA